MARNRFLLALGLALVSGTSLPAADPPPNIIVIVIDDLGYGELSCQAPDTDIPSPNLDAIAAAGVRFTDGYVTAPFCAASRAGLLTGRYQTRFGFEFNPIGAVNEEPGIGLPVTERTLADVLRDERGYTTALIGKWHLGGTAPFHPQRRGFDEFFGFLHEGHLFFSDPPPYGSPGAITWLRRRTLPNGGQGRWVSPDGRLFFTTHLGRNEPDYDADNPILRSSQPVAETANLTGAFTREAIAFVDRNRDRPFFLFLAYNAVHSPMQASEAYWERFAAIEDPHRRIFAAMLAHLDDSIGQLTTALRERHLEENTLLFVISDNGGPTKELTSRNGPLRGEKGSLWEGGIRVPFLLRWPGKFPTGTVDRQPVSSLDIFATAAAACGIPTTGDGVNLLHYVTGDNSTAPHPELYWRVGQQAALRSGPWKLIRPPGAKSSDTPWQLYRLDQDIGETKDLANEEPDTVSRLADRWSELDAEMIDPLWR
jgi:arylsulfatase A-like enzyme